MCFFFLRSTFDLHHLFSNKGKNVFHINDYSWYRAWWSDPSGLDNSKMQRVLRRHIHINRHTHIHTYMQNIQL